MAGFRAARMTSKWRNAILFVMSALALLFAHRVGAFRSICRHRGLAETVADAAINFFPRAQLTNPVQSLATPLSQTFGVHAFLNTVCGCAKPKFHSREKGVCRTPSRPQLGHAAITNGTAG